MNAQLVILRKATTDTGKTFYWYEHISIGYGTDIMRDLGTVHGNNNGRTFTIEADRLFPFKTMREAIEFAERNNVGADMNGTGLDAFIKEMNRKS